MVDGASNIIKVTLTLISTNEEWVLNVPEETTFEEIAMAMERLEGVPASYITFRLNNKEIDNASKMNTYASDGILDLDMSYTLYGSCLVVYWIICCPCACLARCCGAACFEGITKGMGVE